MSEGNTPESIQFSINRIKKVKILFISPNGYWYTSDYLRKLGLHVGFKCAESWGSMATSTESHEIYKMKIKSISVDIIKYPFH